MVRQKGKSCILISRRQIGKENPNRMRKKFKRFGLSGELKYVEGCAATLQTVCRRRKGLINHVSNGKCGAMNKLSDNTRLHFKSRSKGKCGAMKSL